MFTNAPAVIVGAGLSGLCAALHLQQAGQPVVILEASNAVGGRIRTDKVDGFLLDRGFQVLLTAYPQVQELLDLPALGLESFTPGALSYFNGRLNAIRDPFRQPGQIVGGLLSPVGSLLDKIRVGMLRIACLAAQPTLLTAYNSPSEGVSRPFANTTTQTYLEGFGFSPQMMTRFFKPFLGGVFLDPDLSLNAEYFRFLFGCFSVGNVSLPAQGMQAIPQQLAKRLPEGSIRLNSPVSSLHRNQVTLASGEQLQAKAVILATDAGSAGKLLGVSSSVPLPGFRRTRCLYFSAPKSPIAEPILVLNGEGSGAGFGAGSINTLCVPTLVQAGYATPEAPPGYHLISISVLGDCALLPEADVLSGVLAQARDWFGAQVEGWTLLKTYPLAHALPQPGWAEALQGQADSMGITLCGDYSPGLPFSPSIQGAMLSGQRASENVLCPKDHHF